MIDRKALWIFIAAFLAVTGASIWQLNLLPDWRHMPLGGPGSHNTVSGLVLFAAPASLLLPYPRLQHSAAGIRAIWVPLPAPPVTKPASPTFRVGCKSGHGIAGTCHCRAGLPSTPKVHTDFSKGPNFSGRSIASFSRTVVASLQARFASSFRPCQL